MSLRNPLGNIRSDAGYVKVQRHPRNAMASFGFALVTVAAFSAALAVPSIAQSQLTGYKYPAKQVRQTQPQDGWLYTASVPAFNPVVSVAPIEQSQADGYRARTKGVRVTEPQPVYDLAGTYAPAVSQDTTRLRRAAPPFRYPLASSGFSTDGTTPETWSPEKFQPANSERTPLPRSARYRYENQPGADWLYLSLPPAFDPAATVAAVAQSQLDRYRVRAKWGWQTDRMEVHGLLGLYAPAWAIESIRPQKLSRWRPVEPMQDGWLYQAIPVADVWDASKFQNGSGERMATRAASRYRYPLASAGFSTDGSSPAPVDPWTEAKFQNAIGERTAERRKYDPRQEFHKFPFGLVDARVIMPAIDQLSNSERSAPRRGKPSVTPDSYGWLYPNIPAQFDPQLLVHSSDDRLRDRHKKVLQLDQPAQDWIYTAIPPFDARLLIHTSAPQRMNDREKLDVRWALYYNDMSWLKDVLGLVDLPPSATHHKRPIAPIMRARHRRRRC